MIDKKIHPTYILPFMGIPLLFIMEDTPFYDIAIDIINRCNKDAVCTEEEYKAVAECSIRNHLGEDMIADEELANVVRYILRNATPYDKIYVDEEVVCVRILIDDSNKLSVETVTLYPSKVHKNLRESGLSGIQSCRSYWKLVR